MKICCTCKENKSLDEFSKNTKSSDGKQYHCKTCAAISYKNWYEGGGKARTIRTPEQKLRERELKTLREFGLSLDDYNTILESQGGGCAICGKKENNNRKQKRLPIDHHHESNTVRGILCHSCNLMLGLVKDNPDTLEKGAAYLRRNHGICG